MAPPKCRKPRVVPPRGAARRTAILRDPRIRRTFDFIVATLEAKTRYPRLWEIEAHLEIGPGAESTRILCWLIEVGWLEWEAEAASMPRKQRKYRLAGCRLRLDPLTDEVALRTNRPRIQGHKLVMPKPPPPPPRPPSPGAEADQMMRQIYAAFGGGAATGGTLVRTRRSV